MTTANDVVTLVAVLRARPCAKLTELVTAAAGAGATTAMVALAGQAARAARLAFELADFAAGAAVPESSLSSRDVDALVAAARTQGVELVMSVADEGALARVRDVPLAVLHLPAAALLDLPLVSGAAGAGVPLWLDTAMASIEEVAEAVVAAAKVGERVLLLQSPVRFVVNYLRGVHRDLRFVRRYGRPWRSVVELVPQRFMEVYGTYRGVKASAAEIRRG